MKPIKLTMQAFGSYGEKTVIDFTRPNQNLFLITGDTGSGKTTIFDAIVFALYGKASSQTNEKNGIELQSQYVDLSVEPFVELTFSSMNGEEEEIYTVHRVPRHMRLLKRGTGSKDESESISLIMPDGKEYPQKEANAKLEEIIGLTKSQFMQVAMIAQGEFRQLLRAKSDEKKVTFRKLFGTEIFQDIVNELADRRRAKQTQIAQIKTACQTEIGHVDIPSENVDNYEEMREIRKRILTENKLSISDLETFTRGLEELCNDLKAQVKAAAGEEKNAGDDYLKLRDAWSHGAELKKRYDELDSAEETLARCESEKSVMDEKAALMTKIAAAWEIMHPYRSLLDKTTQVRETGRKLEELKAHLEEKEASYETAEQARKIAAEEQQKKLSAFTQAEEKVNQALGLLTQIETLKKELEGLKDAHVKALQSVTKTNEALGKLDLYEKSLQERMTALAGADGALVQWQAKSDNAARLMEDLSAVKAQKKDAEVQYEIAAKAANVYNDVRGKELKKTAECDEKRRAYMDEQAGFLAMEQLVEGEPCPVCGSLSHPHPRKVSEQHQNLTRELIEKLEKERDRLRSDAEAKAKTAGSAADLFKEKKKNLSESTGRLLHQMKQYISVEAETITLQMVEKLILEWSEALAGEGEKRKQDAAELKKAGDALAALPDKRSELRTAADAAVKEEGKTATDLASAVSKLDSLQKTCEFSDKMQANDVLQTARKQKEQADSTADRAQKLSAQAKTSLDNDRALINQYEKDIPVMKEEEAARQSAYLEKMQEKELSEEEWKELTMKYPLEETDRLRREIEKYRTDMNSARVLKESAVKAIGEEVRPDIEALKQAAEQAEVKKNELQKQLDQIKVKEQTNAAALKALTSRMEERRHVVEEYGRVENLYNALAGNVRGSRMDIETFVQRRYLEQILEAANVRFEEMSAGQFSLRMYDLESAGEGKNHGLDLMVYSNVTGKKLPAYTLSGGESFMAALSLALGMADEIQAGKASINLDMMFIDEGFGSLDDNAREQAVRVLQQMAGSSKLIGIISHVSELKQVIEDQLAVSRDKDGSHVRWQIS